MNAYELGQRRVSVSALPLLARWLRMSVEELIGEPQTPSRRRRLASKLIQHVERASALPKTQHRTVMNVIEAILAQQGR